MIKQHPKPSNIAKFFWISIGSILYTYFGYPILITLLARLIPQRGEYPESTPFVTLLIAAYNEENVIDEKIQNTLSLDYPEDRLQILIVADGSNDNTTTIIKNYSQSGVELLYKPERRGKMAAINRAMSFARGDFIVFSDANNIFSPQTIRELIKPFNNASVGAVSGAKKVEQSVSKVGTSEGLYWKYESFVKEQESRLSSCTTVAGEVWAIRREAFQAPPDNIINDDFYMAMQVLKKGYRIVYVPTAISVERASSSAEGEIARRKRIIAGRYQAIFNAPKILPIYRPLLVWQIISHKFMRPLVPFFMIGTFITNLISVFNSNSKNSKQRIWNLSRPFNYIFLLLQLIFYGLVWFGHKREKTGNAGKFRRLLYLPTFLFNSNLAALKGFFEYVSGKQTHLWERVSRE